jgi:DNA polymerase-3 subunit delta
LAASTRKTAWYQAIAKAGMALYAWALPPARLAGWVAARAKSRGLALNADAARLLAAHTEGNLLAAAQEIDRLALLYPKAPIGVAEVSAAAADHARFDIFDLPAKAIDGDRLGALKCLARLRAEGVDAVPITWALVNDIRTLYRATRAARANRLDAVMAKVYMPPARKRQIAAAARRSDPTHLAALLRRAGALDRINKGAAAGRAWDELLTLTLGLAGQALRRPAIASNHDL